MNKYSCKRTSWKKIYFTSFQNYRRFAETSIARPPAAITFIKSVFNFPGSIKRDLFIRLVHCLNS